MTLLNILILLPVCLLMGWLSRGSWRVRILLVGSILTIFWLQPSTPIRHLDFWFPTLSLGLSILVWSITHPAKGVGLRPNLPAALLIVGTVLFIGLLRYMQPLCCLTPTLPPELWQIAIALMLTTVLVILIAYRTAPRIRLAFIAASLILGLFAVLKIEPLATLVSGSLRSINGQSTSLASALDLRWLGFSYVAFRLVHALRDRMTGRLSDYTLAEFVIYIIFFPSLTAGPIDRIQRFIQDLRKPFHLDGETILKGGSRVMRGIFSKYVLADSLAIIALNDMNAAQTSSPGWLWILLYAYALRIYFDFSGYTDIAIGMGNWLGFNLPENFNRPYLKPNLTQFWNSWHITLAQWFRAYYFNPLTRSLRTSPRQIPMPLIILIGQTSTMLLIGLWHGVSWNFAIWGLWHGIGLFIHNRWSEFIRPRFNANHTNTWLVRSLDIISVFLTFNYVALGWVWFALLQPNQSWLILLRMLGFEGGS